MRRLIVLPVIAGMLTASVLVVASPAQAKRLTKGVYFNSNGACEIGDKWCGGDLWVIIPKKYIPNPEQRSSVSWALKSKSGKKTKLYYADPVYDGADKNVGDDVGGVSLWKEGRDQGLDWWLPTKLKRGKYTLSITIKAHGVWDCSMEYYEVCKWIKPYTYKRTMKLALRSLSPDEWYPAA